jgi:hypothetical protein
MADINGESVFNRSTLIEAAGSSLFCDLLSTGKSVFAITGVSGAEFWEEG